MTTLKIAIQLAEHDDVPRASGPGTVIHAYDTEDHRFPYHDGIEAAYTVKPDIGWGVVLQQRQPVCSVCKAGHEQAA
ncbi:MULTISPECIES: hypothetical protein [Streptomyces]|uniref:hypothetical protein n=1 Tax=Streptomyces TaxID=1883 RepID=UPI00167B2F5F|nr:MULTISPECIES: hypothetical protein [Streptomyces]MBK3524845.1 hypothetical protein [Streptomyces sp. MBT70]